MLCKILDFRTCSEFYLERILASALDEIARRGGLDAVHSWNDDRVKGRRPNRSTDEQRWGNDHKPTGRVGFLNFLECEDMVLVDLLDAITDAIAIRGGLAKVRTDAADMRRDIESQLHQSEMHAAARRRAETGDDEIPF